MACLLCYCNLSDTNWFQTNCYHRAKKQKTKEKRLPSQFESSHRPWEHPQKRGNCIKERLFWCYGWYTLHCFPTPDDSNADSLRNSADVCLQRCLNVLIFLWKRKHGTVNKNKKDKGNKIMMKSQAAFHLLVKVAMSEVEVKYTHSLKWVFFYDRFIAFISTWCGKSSLYISALERSVNSLEAGGPLSLGLGSRGMAVIPVFRTHWYLLYRSVL